MNTVLAIDIGGTFTKIGIVDDTREILVSKVFNTRSKESFTSFLKELRRDKRTYPEFRGKSKILAVGVGAPIAISLSEKCNDFRTCCSSLDTIGNASMKV